MIAYFIGVFCAVAAAGTRAASQAPNSRRVIVRGHYPTRYRMLQTPFSKRHLPLVRQHVEYLLATTTHPPKPVRDTLPIPWLRWAIVLVPGLLIYFVPISGLTAPQSHLL